MRRVLASTAVVDETSHSEPSQGHCGKSTRLLTFSPLERRQAIIEKWMRGTEQEGTTEEAAELLSELSLLASEASQVIERLREIALEEGRPGTHRVNTHGNDAQIGGLTRRHEREHTTTGRSVSFEPRTANAHPITTAPIPARSRTSPQSSRTSTRPTDTRATSQSARDGQEPTSSDIGVGDKVFITNKISHVPNTRTSTPADRAAVVTRLHLNQIHLKTINRHYTWRIRKNLRKITDQEYDEIAYQFLR